MIKGFFNMDIKETLKALNERPIAYHSLYKRMTNSVHGGILISQLMYWFTKKNVFWKTNNELMDEIDFTLRELRTAKLALSKITFISISKHGIPAKNFYTIDWDDYIKSINEFLTSEKSVTTSSDETVTTGDDDIDITGDDETVTTNTKTSQKTSPDIKVKSEETKVSPPIDVSLVAEQQEDFPKQPKEKKERKKVPQKKESLGVDILQPFSSLDIEEKKKLLFTEINIETLNETEQFYYTIATGFRDLIMSYLTALGIKNIPIDKSKATAMDVVRLMVEKDQFSREDLVDIYKQLKVDEFWQGNVRCFATLRRQATAILVKYRSQQKKAYDNSVEGVSQQISQGEKFSKDQFSE